MRHVAGRSFLRRHENIVQLLAVTIFIFALMAALSPDKFLRYYNFESITFVFPELGILALAMMVAMLTGCIDLSVVGVANRAGVLAGAFLHHAGPAPNGPAALVLVGEALMIALTTGLVAGAFNGVLIAKVKITPILATLGVGLTLTGVAVVITGGPAIVGFPDAWGFLGNGKCFGVPVPLLLFVAVAVVLSALITKTPFGIALTLIGTNAKAAVFAGLRCDRIVFFSYVLSGFLASVAGIIVSGRTNAAKSDYGTSYLLQAVLISVLGGTNPSGGRGSVLGVCIAVVALMLLGSGMQILRFSNHLTDFVWGAFLLIVIAINALRARFGRSDVETPVEPVTMQSGKAA